MTLPLLFVPGLLCDEALWAAQIAAFAAKREVQVADVTKDEAIDSMALRVLDAAPERFCLAALSMGGYVALSIMRIAPERVERLALVDTSARPDSQEQASRRRGLIALARQGRFKGVTPRLLPLLVHPDRIDDPSVAGVVMDMAERVGRAAFIRQQTAILGRIDSRPHLAAIGCPTVVICGRQDAITPPDVAMELADGIAGASLHIVEDSGHLTPLERPEAVTRILSDWLDRRA